jgi:hypothetical protein
MEKRNIAQEKVRAERDQENANDERDPTGLRPAVAASGAAAPPAPEAIPRCQSPARVIRNDDHADNICAIRVAPAVKRKGRQQGVSAQGPHRDIPQSRRIPGNDFVFLALI